MNAKRQIKGLIGETMKAACQTFDYQPKCEQERQKNRRQVNIIPPDKKVIKCSLSSCLF